MKYLGIANTQDLKEAISKVDVGGTASGKSLPLLLVSVAAACEKVSTSSAIDDLVGEAKGLSGKLCSATLLPCFADKQTNGIKIHSLCTQLREPMAEW